MQPLKNPLRGKAKVAQTSNWNVPKNLFALRRQSEGSPAGAAWSFSAPGSAGPSAVSESTMGDIFQGFFDFLRAAL